MWLVHAQFSINEQLYSIADLEIQTGCIASDHNNRQLGALVFQGKLQVPASLLPKIGYLAPDPLRPYGTFQQPLYPPRILSDGSRNIISELLEISNHQPASGSIDLRFNRALS